MHNIIIRKDLKLKYSLFWIKQAFITFREKPLQFLILGIFNSILTMLPFIGAFLSPLFAARFAYCANKVENHEQLSIGEIFKGLFANRLVLRLAFINFCLSTVIILAEYFLNIPSESDKFLATDILLFLLLYIPAILLGISMWLSPVLCLFNDDVEPKSAMWLSLQVCFYNIIVLLAFSIIIGGISLAIGAPSLLILLKLWDTFHNIYLMIPVFIVISIIGIVWLTILNITTYYVYKMIYKKRSVNSD
ncbi:MAG: hypothetical protein ACK5Z5_04135 [Neisseriaceae bacterium]